MLSKSGNQESSKHIGLSKTTCFKKRAKGKQEYNAFDAVSKAYGKDLKKLEEAQCRCLRLHRRISSSWDWLQLLLLQQDVLGGDFLVHGAVLHVVQSSRGHGAI